MTTVDSVPEGPRSAEQSTSAVAADSVDDWLRSLVPAKGLGAKAHALLHQLQTHPSRASYASAHELATASGTTVATVTRLAQSLGFEGWPDLQRQIRTRHLSYLSLTEVIRAHQGSALPSHSSVQQDLDSLAVFLREVDHDQLNRIATGLGSAHRIYISAEGSYSSIAIAMAHNTRLAGYDAHAIVDGGATLANSIAKMQPGDVYVVVSFWRLYESALIASTEAKKRGVSVFVISDTVPRELQDSADEIILVPSEGASFFPSLTTGMAAQQAIVTALSTIDAERTGASIKAADESWRRFKLLHR
ncbi:MurR/RpiR family transcriptional regulator [Saxibacter everestensis]|uniref:MurR/RpiR family transcriptional regulator n=1 Tax=Saxibacter everestensis TaxID=2909229 RepID=A0ABY8QSI8_9MICO|nr:MurR/RpiR family transcriptional regulator [Brevibacteriaceae bacterium ZFBP1038]